MTGPLWDELWEYLDGTLDESGRTLHVRSIEHLRQMLRLTNVGMFPPDTHHTLYGIPVVPEPAMPPQRIEIRRGERLILRVESVPT